MVRLRKLEKSDLPETFRWHNDSEISAQILSFPPPISWEEELKWFERVHDKEIRGESQLRIVQLGHQPVGFVTLRPDPALKEVDFGIVIGNADCRGQGVGTQTLSLVFVWVQNQWPDFQLTLVVRKDNLKALQFYERQGFRKAQNLQIQKHGQIFEVIKMIRASAESAI